MSLEPEDQRDEGDDSERLQASDAKARPKDLAEVLAEFQEARVANQEEDVVSLVDRFLIKYPAYASAIHRAGRDMMTDPGEASLGLDKSRQPTSRTPIFDGDATVVGPRPSQIDADLEITRVSLGTPKSPQNPPRSQTQSAMHSRSLDVPERDLPDSVPEAFDRFKLIRELGRGGMGVVYLGVDDLMQRFVAVKVLPAEYSHHPELLERFLREQDAVSRLQHPGIVPVYATGEQDDVHYYVMRYVEGRPLDVYFRDLWEKLEVGSYAEGSQHDDTKLDFQQTSKKSASKRRDQVLRQSGVTPDDAYGIGELLHIIEQTSRALHFAHENGVTHRDVKPNNVVVDMNGNPQLLDFGLAKQTDEVSLTGTGRLLGTVPYMSPEQVAGNRIGIDHRTDLYSLGVTLYEGLTGRRPFSGEDHESLMFEILMKDPIPPRRFNPKLPRSIDVVVLKCLEKNPHHRFANCEAFAEELARIRAHQRILSEPVGFVGRIWRWSSRHKKVASLACTALLVLMVLVGILLQGRWQAATRRRQDANTQVEDARQQLHSAGLLTEPLAAANRRHDAFAQEDPELFDLQQYSQNIETRKKLYRDRSRLLSLACRRLDESLALVYDPEVRQLRNDVLLQWFQEAAATQDMGTLRAIQKRVADLPIAERFRSTGKLSLSTEPAGAKVLARPYIADSQGQLILGEDSISLGETPLGDIDLEAGSWQLEITHDKTQSIVYPLLIETGEHWGHPSWQGRLFAKKDWTVTLPMKGDIDFKRWAFVAKGPFLSTFPATQRSLRPALVWRWTDSFAMQRKELTFGEYADYLGQPESVEEILTEIQHNQWSYLLPFFLGEHQTKEPHFDIDQETGQIRGSHALHPSLANLEKHALCGVTQEAAIKFCQDGMAAENRVMRLPRADEWEKAARGVDGRLYPWGNEFDWSFTSGRRSHEQALKRGSLPSIPGTFATDQSPYGLLDMAGNAAEWCSNGPLPEYAWFAGGARMDSGPTDFLAWPLTSALKLALYDDAGFRPLLEWP